MRCNCPIPDNDVLYRHAIHPVAFRGPAFAPEKFLHLKAVEDGFEGSLAWARFLPTTERLHAYGCRLARQRNETKRATGTYKERDRQIYAGAYSLRALDVRELGSQLEELLSADAIHQIEQGEIAHVALKIILRPGLAADPEGTKTAVLALLWDACSGPLRYRCNYDADIDDHPSQRLTNPPLGSFSDQRRLGARLWAVLRCYFLDWVMRKILRCDGL